MNPQLILTWLDEHPDARDYVYTTVLAIAGILAVLCYGLPMIDVDHIWRIDLDELGKISIVTGGAAAYLAKRNVPASDPDDDPPAV
jgi:hypothetical protein